jgi:hypothetical protein
MPTARFGALLATLREVQTKGYIAQFFEPKE